MFRLLVYGVFFDIFFDKENIVLRFILNRGIIRFISNEGFILDNNRVFKNIRKNLFFKLVNGEEEEENIEEEFNLDFYSDFKFYVVFNINELNFNENIYYKFLNGVL